MFTHAHYNCGGYALGTLDWYMPYCGDSISEDDDCYEDYSHEMVDFMLEDFDGIIRIAESLEDCQEGERLVAFRCGDDDFHYIKITSDGRFFHKRGCYGISEMSREEFFDGDGWCDGYYWGKIWYLALTDNE